MDEGQSSFGALLAQAAEIGPLLVAAGQSVGVAESSSGGLVAAALLAVPGASAFFLGGAVVYTKAARTGLLDLQPAAMKGIRPSTEPYSLLLADTIRTRLGATWGIAETGAAGPTGNGYGDPPGHSCMAIAGPVHRAATVQTGSADRVANMNAFASALLALFAEALS